MTEPSYSGTYPTHCPAEPIITITVKTSDLPDNADTTAAKLKQLGWLHRDADVSSVAKLLRESMGKPEAWEAYLENVKAK